MNAPPTIVLAAAMAVATAPCSIVGGSRVCDDTAAPVRSVWNESARDRAGDAAAAIDDYTAAWKVMRRENCDATTHHGQQSGRLHGARNDCLDERLVSLAALLAADPTPARDTVAALRPVAECSRDATLERIRTE